MSLRTRLLLGLTALVLAAIVSSGWLVLAVAHGRLRVAQEAQARLTGDELGRALGVQVSAAEPLDGPGNRARLSAAARSLVGHGDLRALVVADERGRPVVALPPAARADDWALSSARGPGVWVERRGQELYVYAPLDGPTGTVGTLRLTLGGEDELARALRSAYALLALIALLDGGLILLFGLLFIRGVVGPLRLLAENARRVAEGQLDVPPVPARPHDDELSHLTEAFNRMTASLRTQRDQMVAQEKLVTVGRLAAGVAHEVGNPLAAVIGYAEMLLADEMNRAEGAPEAGRALPDEEAREDPSLIDRRDMLERIRKETHRIRGIIADLLDYSRPVAGRLEPVPLHEAVEAAVGLLRPQARFRGVTVDNRVPVELPPAAASADRVAQVLINLLLNAADAMGGSGTITVAGRAAGASVELSVRDSGPGIPAEDRARVFDPFFTTKEPGQGTGLGLAISRSIAQAYGGALVLAPPDGDGAGAELILRLPAAI